MKPRLHCPGCDNASLSTPFELPRQPVILNYRFKDRAAAARVRRGDVTLQQCRRCGLVFNATFDLKVVPYDENYENRQSHSPSFQRHLGRLAREIVQRNPLRGGRILEVGCGKGDFLRLLCAEAGATGEGYDTSYERPSHPEPEGLAFHRRYVGAADITAPFDAVICRHVVEHVPEIGGFLRELQALAVAAGDPVVVLETPRFEWIVEQTSLWDVFYEHCNYFPMASLAHLCRLAGFRVVRHRRVFGAQYQVLELRLNRLPQSGSRPPTAPGITAGARLSSFTRHARRHLNALARRFSTAAAGRGWAVWGAGAKGVALVNYLVHDRPRCVIDSNPAKQGGILPGTKVPIVSPEDAQLLHLGLIVIANPNYVREIRAVLRQRGYSGQILTL